MPAPDEGRAADRPAADAPGVLVFPPLLALGVLLVGVGAHLLLPAPLAPRVPLRFAGAACAAAAVAIVMAARSEMARAGTNVNPSLPSTAVVTAGPYRFTRNPMYLSLCLLNLGIGLLLCDLVPVALTAVLAAILNYGVIVREERYLERKFGGAYLAYRGRVRRWL
jgi:protein-S-isoprenylcysteine O-methyltransferase Ste14